MLPEIKLLPGLSRLDIAMLSMAFGVTIATIICTIVYSGVCS